MKLASLKSGGRDGRLVMVSRDLKNAVSVADICPTMQQALDNWNEISPRLRSVYDSLNDGETAGIVEFKPEEAAAPLPRAYHWVDSSGYVNHIELVRKARGAEMPPSFWDIPVFYQGGGDDLMGPRDDIVAADEAHGIDMEAEVAVITGDIPMASSGPAAAQHIHLIMLANDVSLRNLIPGELAKGFGFYQSKPSTAFSPVAVTPDELGAAWDGSKLSLPLITRRNGQLQGRPNAGEDVTFGFPEIITHLAKTRKLGAGTIVGGGTVSNYERSRGSSCIAELRMLETIASGAPTTPFLRFGETVQIEMLDADGQSIFGAIDQKIVPAG